MSHYLITGGAGFIGSHLADALLAAGHQVTIIDNLSTGTRANLPANAAFIEGDCGNPSLIAPLVHTVDGVFHLAAIASVQRSQEDWLATSRTNSLAAIALLEAIARRDSVIPFVYASSAAVYGNPDVPLVSEDTPTRPLTPYGADKCACELHAGAARHVFGIPTLGMRFFNVYGPRQDPHSPYSGVISIFMDRLRHGAPIAIYGDGEQTRDFIYVGDVVTHLLAAMALLHQRTPDQPVLNVCSGHSVSINTLVATMVALLGSSSSVLHQDARAGDIRHSLGNPSQASGLLQQRANVSLSEGLQMLMNEMN